jgi:hypothetical protein
VKIAEWLSKEKHSEFTARDIRRKEWREFAKERDSEAIDGALRLLEAHGWVAIQEAGPGVRGGRPTQKAVVNPAVYRG